MHKFPLAIALLVLVASCGRESDRVAISAEPATVFAAASLREALTEAGQQFAAQGHPVPVFNFAASNVLAQQIRAANKADLFFSADEVQMDGVEQAALLVTGTRHSLVSNRLVVIQPSELPAGVPRIETPADLARAEIVRISLANPEAVPAGKYAKAWLEQQGLWERVSARVVPGVDVRAALALVESGSAEAGVVYATDAAITTRVRVAWTVSREEGPKISYPLAQVANGPSPDEGRAFHAFLRSNAARDVFRRHGFAVEPGS